MHSAVNGQRELQRLPQDRRLLYKNTSEWFPVSLTIHFDMEGNGGIGQVALGVECVLSLLLCIHPLQLQPSVVSKEGCEKRGSEMTNSVVSVQTVPIYPAASSSF